MASVWREKKIGLTPTGHSERKSKFCDNEIPSPAVPRYAFDRRRQDPLSQAKSQNRRRRNLVGDQNYSAAPYNDYRKSLRITAVAGCFLCLLFSQEPNSAEFVDAGLLIIRFYVIILLILRKGKSLCF